MKKKYKITISIVLLFCFSSYSQKSQNNSQQVPAPTKTRQQLNNQKSNNLVSPSAFNTLARRSLNFLILGESSTNQGLEFELNEERTEISASGYLNIGNMLGTIEGDFTANDGVYFFDQSDKATKATFTFNLFGTFESRKYNVKDNLDSQLAFIKKAIYEVDSVEHYKKNYALLKKFIKSELGIDFIDVDCGSKKIPLKYKNYCKDFEKHSELFDISSYNLGSNEKAEIVKKYAKDGENGDRKFEIKKFDEEENEITNRHWPITITLDKKINYIKLIKDFEKYESRYLALKDSLDNQELNNVKDIWNSKKVTFGGGSIFYSREILPLFDQESTSSNFSDRFIDERGTLFGIRGQLNRLWQNSNSRFVLLRGLIGLSRGSNFDSFTKRTFGVFQGTGQPLEGDEVNIIQSKEAYISSSPYEFGFRQDYTFEVYWKFLENIGIFGSVGYNRTGFNSEEVSSIERYPLRTGVLLSLISKNDKDVLLTLQLFLDRTNLNLYPSGEEGDLRFGFRVGLPVNIGKNL
ncbi:MAG: hypothetical protein AB3N18_09965 [Allomuricauda sp.]